MGISTRSHNSSLHQIFNPSTYQGTASRLGARPDCFLGHRSCGFFEPRKKQSPKELATKNIGKKTSLGNLAKNGGGKMGKEMWPKRNCTFDFNTFIGLKVELPCQKTKSFWTKSLHVLSLQKSSNFYSSRFKKTQRSPSCWSMENWSSIPNDHFSLRMSSHVGSNFCPNMSMPKKNSKNQQKLIQQKCLSKIDPNKKSTKVARSSQINGTSKNFGICQTTTWALQNGYQLTLEPQGLKQTPGTMEILVG